jgi:LPXTG-motif cell wall-anchored protein
MIIKKKILFKLFILSIIPILALLITQKNSYQAEEKPITLLPDSRLFTVYNMAPGDTVTKSLKIINNSEETFQYNIITRHESDSIDFFNELNLQVTDNSSVLFNGKLKNFTLSTAKQLNKNDSEDLSFQIEMPINLGNEFQGLTSVVGFVFTAVGDSNPPDPPDDGDPPDPPDDGDPPDPPDDGDPPDPPDDGDPPDPPDDGDPPDPPDDGDPPDPPDDGDPPDPPDDGDPPDPPDDNEPPPNDNEPPNTNEPPSNNPAPTKPADPPSKDTGLLPQTGEENPILIILSGFFISLAGIGLLLIKKSIIPNPFKRG